MEDSHLEACISEWLNKKHDFLVSRYGPVSVHITKLRKAKLSWDYSLTRQAWAEANAFVFGVDWANENAKLLLP